MSYILPDFVPNSYDFPWIYHQFPNRYSLISTKTKCFYLTNNILLNTHKVFSKHKTYMNAQETFCILPILTLTHSNILIHYPPKHLNPTLYSLLKETSYKYLDQCHCQLLVSSTWIFIYTLKNKISYHISRENFSRTPLK